jgi:hypothetical protein
MPVNTKRRELLMRAAQSMALLPFLATMRQASGATNAAVRAQLQYQNTPKENKNCRSCLEFLSNQIDDNLGGCAIIPGDNEISPNGYCLKWNTI